MAVLYVQICAIMRCVIKGLYCIVTFIACTMAFVRFSKDL